MIDEPIRVAFADDHIAVRKGIIAFINNLGGIQFDIEADNGKELLKQIEKAGECPDVCLLDINMPEMNGFDTLIELKKKWPDIKVIILTVFELENYIIRMVRNGANGYLLKSCDPREIKKAILSVYHDGMYYSNKMNPNFFQAILGGDIKLANLTAKEIQVLKYSCSDLHFTQIAKKIGTTPRSVDGIRDSLHKKLNVNSRIGLAMFAVQVGLVTIEMNTSEDKKYLHKKQKQ